MVIDVCCDTIGLRIKVNAGGMTSHNTMGLPFLCMTFKVRNTHLDMVDQVTSPFPMDCHYITSPLSGLCLVVVVEESFWF